MPKLKDVPQFTSWGRYAPNVGWGEIEFKLTTWAERSHGVDLDPDFQRGHVWTEDKQIAYVEYCLRGGTIARELIFNCPGWQTDFRGPMQLVDGKQRLQAVRRFMAGEIKVFGHFISEYEDAEIVMRVQDFTFRVNDLSTRAEVLKLYLELNTGGVVHTAEEISRVQTLLDLETAHS